MALCYFFKEESYITCNLCIVAFLCILLCGKPSRFPHPPNEIIIRPAVYHIF